MQILYIDWEMYGKEDIIEAFEEIEYEVFISNIPIVLKHDKMAIANELEKQISSLKYNYIFTSNYYPIVSDICEVYGVKYISWIYDSPLINLYDKSILNSCNYVFMFDSFECEYLRSLGVQHIFYMPLAVNSKRLDKIEISSKDREIFGADVSLVASLYNEKHNLYDRMEPKLSEYAKGYLNGLMDIQRKLFGAFVLEEPLVGSNVLKEMYNAMPYNISEGSLATIEYVYANYFLARKVASMQRLELIDRISRNHNMKVYTGGDLSELKHVKHMGTVDYMSDMNKVFKLSKININMTLPSIKTGVPLRVMDILGNGGFLITNYQKDLFELFEPDVDFVYYSDVEQIDDLINYYLEHEEEREKIARNAKEKMAMYHNYTDRVKDIMYIVENV